MAKHFVFDPKSWYSQANCFRPGTKMDGFMFWQTQPDRIIDNASLSCLVYALHENECKSVEPNKVEFEEHGKELFIRVIISPPVRAKACRLLVSTPLILKHFQLVFPDEQNVIESALNAPAEHFEAMRILSAMADMDFELQYSGRYMTACGGIKYNGLCSRFPADAQFLVLLDVG